MTVCYVEDGGLSVLDVLIRCYRQLWHHDLANVGKETLRAVAFFAAAMFTQEFDDVMLPPKTHILGTPNRGG
jgi:hypothetical protein